MRDRIVAHRGNAMEHRENSLDALRSALELGVKYIEFDVQLSADGVPCLLHDAYLTRLFRKDIGAVDTKFDALSSYGIASLAQAMDLLRGRDVQLFVEIKTDAVAEFGQKAVVDAVCDLIDSCQCIVISFDADVCLLARDRGFRVGYILSDLSDQSEQKCKALMPEYVFCDQRHIQKMVWEGPVWCSYEVSSTGVAVRLLDCGVHLLETMSVRKMLRC